MFIKKLKMWWKGEDPNTAALYRGARSLGYELKQPLAPPIIARVFGSIWSFWLRRWTVFLPLIVGALVALFIHFDSDRSDSVREQNQKNTHEKNSINESAEKT